MHVRIKDVTGDVYTTDAMTKAAMLEEVGGDEYRLLDNLSKILDMFKNIGHNDLNHITVCIEGQQRSFNPKNIVWIEIHGLEEFDLDA